MNARHDAINIIISWQVLDWTKTLVSATTYAFGHEKALDKFFIIAPDLSKLLHAFTAERTEVTTTTKNKTPWHDKLSWMMTNARKLTNVFRDPFVAAENEDEICNILTMEVMTGKKSV